MLESYQLQRKNKFEILRNDTKWNIRLLIEPPTLLLIILCIAAEHPSADDNRIVKLFLIYSWAWLRRADIRNLFHLLYGDDSTYNIIAFPQCFRIQSQHIYKWYHKFRVPFRILNCVQSILLFIFKLNVSNSNSSIKYFNYKSITI